MADDSLNSSPRTNTYNKNTGRIQHLTPNGAGFALVHQIQYFALQYWMGVSHTLPNRVFAGALEFNFNYNVPNPAGDPQAQGGTGSWQLVRDWAVGAGGACGSGGSLTPLSHYFYISAVEQLSNGRIYATMTDSSLHMYMAELPASGTTPMRQIGNPTSPNVNLYLMARDGSFYYLTNSGSGASSVTTMNHIPLTGFNGSNNPTYGSVVPVASATYDSSLAPVPALNGGFGFQSNYEPTTGGTFGVIQFTAHNSSATTNFPHIGGIVAGHGGYLFTVTPEVCSVFVLSNGSYPCAGATSNPGPGILTEGRHVIMPFTTNSSPYTPAFWDYWEDGMFISQFGPFSTTRTPTGPNTIPSTNTPGFYSPYNPAVGFQGAQPIQALGWVENVGSVRLTTVNGDMYMFADAEGGTAPISVWHMSNQASIHELSGTGSLGQTVALSTSVF